ncbi:MAG: AAA family ATPase [Thermoguttaceae bacterium]|nr:AAA family ATPase [Thermoguttaceae bacterium]
MDVAATIGRVKEEYKAFLRAERPEIAENTVATCVADAFYACKNAVFPSFWQTFENDATLEAARATLFDYWSNDVGTPNAKERANRCFGALKTLKSFLDAKGGVRAVVGDEYDCEKTIYRYAKAVYEGTLAPKDAVAAMSAEAPCFSASSHSIFIAVLAAMLDGGRFTRRANVELTFYFLANIAAEYGKERLATALRTTRDNIIYYFEKKGDKSNAMRRGCQKIADANGVPLSFSDEIFGGIVPQETTDETLVDATQVRYWIYAAGEGSENWENDRAQGKMAIGWDELGDLLAYGSKEEMRDKMKSLYGVENSYRNQALTTWQFANEMKPGDVVFVKRGRKQIIGRGVVEGDYVYEPERGVYRHVRAVRWDAAGAWEVAEPLPVKTLIDVTSRSDLVKTMLSLVAESGADVDETFEVAERETVYETYDENDFLADVYLDEERYRLLKTLLATKKNVILQGAPGVGKTFAAKRLAFSMMGEKDVGRVQTTQFHQSYSYEDFVIGFRPTATGFELRKGVFYEFCRKAAEDDRPYFFIIDEINRGNLSKIFGELFMLIENDKRGVELRLPYADERFSIPSNVHLIGAMNTADRSLALIDFALRRRFAFFELEPAFDSEGFRAFQRRVGNPKFDRLIDAVKALNDEIRADETLGADFCVGHSYFCAKTTVDDVWLRSVVEFELIPLLKEYWFDESAKLAKQAAALREAIR